jgi:hypothetical protein
MFHVSMPAPARACHPPRIGHDGPERAQDCSGGREPAEPTAWSGRHAAHAAMEMPEVRFLRRCAAPAIRETTTTGSRPSLHSQAAPRLQSAALYRRFCTGQIRTNAHVGSEPTTAHFQVLGKFTRRRFFQKLSLVAFPQTVPVDGIKGHLPRSLPPMNMSNDARR